MSSIASLKQRIAEYDAKLALLGPDDKRIKKRIFAKLGPLNKQLAALEAKQQAGGGSSGSKKRKSEEEDARDGNENAESRDAGIGIGINNKYHRKEDNSNDNDNDEDDDDDDNDNDNDDEDDHMGQHQVNSSQPLTRKQMKAKVKALNRDLATYAQKKLLNGINTNIYIIHTQIIHIHIYTYIYIHTNLQIHILLPSSYYKYIYIYVYI